MSEFDVRSPFELILHAMAEGWGHPADDVASLILERLEEAGYKVVCRLDWEDRP